MIGATHNFQDVSYAQDWATRFQVTTHRAELFAHMGDLLSEHAAPHGCVVELGTGPGYLAHYLLSRFAGLAYLGLDFSAPMLNLARERLAPFEDRVTLRQADLLHSEWTRGIPAPVDAVVSTWALHDLGSSEAIGMVYRNARPVLLQGGVLLNGDFIKPPGSALDFEPGRIEVSTHLAFLRDAGFSACSCCRIFEEELKNPASAQNYACIVGINGNSR